MIQRVLCLFGKHSYNSGIQDIRSCKRLECPRIEILMGKEWIPAPKMRYNSRLGGLN